MKHTILILFLFLFLTGCSRKKQVISSEVIEGTIVYIDGEACSVESLRGVEGNVIEAPQKAESG
jgi:PBP1b-binding outer membrane lipoprotein LpoB